MIGAIIGDIVGSRFERVNHKSKEFELFDRKCRPTDDSVMTLAIAKAILECKGNFENLSQKAISNMQEFGRIYKKAGYGRSFIKWIWADDPQPYNSYGNGSAMRVSPCGYAATSIEEAKELSAMVTKVTHNHPEGMKGAEAVAVAIYLAKTGKSKEDIKQYIQDNYYNIDFTIDQIRLEYEFDVSCQGSVPVALEAFFESTDFEDAIRNAISVGGDSDTIAAMTGSIAEAFYGVPEETIDSAIDFLDGREMEILYYFEKEYPSKAFDEDGETTISIFCVLDKSVDKVIPAETTITIDGDLDGDVVHAWVDNVDMIPDFSSFDKSDRIEETKEFLEKAGSDVVKTAKKAGEGIFAAAKFTIDSINKAKDKVVDNLENCYELCADNPEDTERIMRAVKLLNAAGYDTRVKVTSGTMRGYVFAKGLEFSKAVTVLESEEGISLKDKPMDKKKADKIKKNAK
ncbi:MAG TPA: hypothetical protein GX736_05920 [Mogibacterium sp.]|nr:hypothetical protein [Mogibacterium sp.]